MDKVNLFTDKSLQYSALTMSSFFKHKSKNPEVGTGPEIGIEPPT